MYLENESRSAEWGMDQAVFLITMHTKSAVHPVCENFNVLYYKYRVQIRSCSVPGKSVLCTRCLVLRLHQLRGCPGKKIEVAKFRIPMVLIF